MDSPRRPAVIGSRFLRNQCCVLIFERAISLFRSGRQTVDSFIHRATRSKMAGFKTAPLFWGYGQGRFFGCAGSAKFCAYSGVSLILTRPGEGGPVRMDTPAAHRSVQSWTHLPKIGEVCFLGQPNFGLSFSWRKNPLPVDGGFFRSPLS